MKICTRGGCTRPGHCWTSPRKFYCVLCNWIATRQRNARKAGKFVPTWEEMCRLIRETCAHCDKTLHYHPDKSAMKSVATLQHNNDGSITVLCHPCNAAHGHVKLGDAWFDVPMGYKHCAKCDKVLPFGRFHRDKHSSIGYQTYCIVCRKQHLDTSNLTDVVA